METTILEEIRARRSATAEQALTMLEMAPLSDTEHKYSLLSGAALYLGHPEVTARWIALAAEEQDTALKALMLRRLAALGIQQIPDPQAYLDLLTNSLAQDEARDTVLHLLGRLSMTHKAAREKLVAFYNTQENADTGRHILLWLLAPADTPDDTLPFLAGLLHKTDEATQWLLLNRLLLQDKAPGETLQGLLQPALPHAIKQMVMRYCFDRSIVFEAELCLLAARDNDPALRLEAIQLLVAHGLQSPAVADTVLGALQADPNAAVRQAAAQAFDYGMPLSPALVTRCCQLLPQVKDMDTMTALLRLLSPHLDRNEMLVSQLRALLAQPLQAALTAWLYALLGRLLPQRPDLFAFFLEAYEKEQHDDCKAAILRAITEVPVRNDALGDLFLKALRAPSPAIREWGVQGVLLLPLVQEHIPVIAAAAPALQEAGISLDKRRLLAKKICCLPQRPPAVIAVLRRISDHEPDTQIRDTCRQALESEMAAGNAGVNWEQWLHQADVEHNLEGIFPLLWLYYDENPAMAEKILWASLNPANSSSLYYGGLDDKAILAFLLATGAGINDDLARYCLHQLLNGDAALPFNHYLVALKSAASLSAFREQLWQVLEKRYRQINLCLLKELLEIAAGQELAAAFEQRLLQQQQPAAITPYLQFLAANAAWPPVPGMLTQAAALPQVQEDNGNRALVTEACRYCRLDAETLLRSREEEGPGFAD